MDPDRYCREIETYLCRKNDGHLIRIAGPSFERVSGWAARGVPIKVVFRGIDRYFDRYYARGPRRRPVRIDFCEADVLDVFDEWRRAVGQAVAAAAGPGAAAGDIAGRPDPGRRPRRSLRAHLERVALRLTSLRARPDVPAGLAAALDRALGEIDAARVAANRCRGEARVALLDRLARVERDLRAAARQECPRATIDQLERDADEELDPYRARMPDDAFRRARELCVDRLLRERAGLPQIVFP